MSVKNEFLLEIGVEELPTTEVQGIVSQLNELIDRYVSSEGLTFEEKVIILAPRRFGFGFADCPANLLTSWLRKKDHPFILLTTKMDSLQKRCLGF